MNSGAPEFPKNRIVCDLCGDVTNSPHCFTCRNWMGIHFGIFVCMVAVWVLNVMIRHIP